MYRYSNIQVYLLAILMGDDISEDFPGLVVKIEFQKVVLQSLVSKNSFK